MLFVDVDSCCLRSIESLFVVGIVGLVGVLGVGVVVLLMCCRWMLLWRLFSSQLTQYKLETQVPVCSILPQGFVLFLQLKYLGQNLVVVKFYFFLIFSPEGVFEGLFVPAKRLTKHNMFGKGGRVGWE